MPFVTKESEYIKNCPICGSIMYYSDKYKLQRSIEENNKCYSCSGKVRVFSDKTLLKMSLSHKNHSSYKTKHVKTSEKTKKKISKSMSGRKLSFQHIKNISKSLKGRCMTPDQIHRSMIGQEKSKYQRKPYILGNDIILIQGYENLTLDKLLSELILIDNIKVKISEKPRIKYKWNGKIHWYYPDCYLDHSNTLVETKSDYTWKKDYEKNQAKLQSSLKNGFNMRIVVWNGKKELVSDTIYRAQ